MDLKRAKILLDRYWNCVSTIEEEAELKTFFNSDEVPDDLMELADIFKYYDSQQQRRLDDKFEQEIIEKINRQKSPLVKKLNIGFKNYLRVAAAVLVVLGASFVFRMNFWQNEAPPTFLVDTYKTPEEAFAETKKAFQLIAEKMNQGRKQTEKIAILSKAEDKIKKEEK